jgi:hypothetical protein
MVNKAELIEALNFSRAELRSFIDSLNGEQRAAEGTLDRWSAKDVVAHLTEWIARLVKDLELAAQPDAPHAVPSNYDNIDETNAEIYAQHQQQSWEELQEEMEGSYKAIKTFAQAASEAELADQQRIPWREGRPLWRMLVGTAVEHPILHLSYYQVENGDIAEAARLQETSVARLTDLDDSPGWRGAQIYNLACIQSLSGQKEKALANLTEALQLVPNLVEWSKQDPDLLGLHNHPAYQALYAS